MNLLGVCREDSQISCVHYRSGTCGLTPQLQVAQSQQHTWFDNILKTRLREAAETAHFNKVQSSISQIKGRRGTWIQKYKQLVNHQLWKKSLGAGEKSPTLSIDDTDDASCEINFSTDRLKFWLLKIHKIGRNPRLKMCWWPFLRNLMTKQTMPEFRKYTVIYICWQHNLIVTPCWRQKCCTLPVGPETVFSLSQWVEVFQFHCVSFHLRW